MTNEVKIFENSKLGKVRTITVNNEPWFVGKDVAEILGYAKPENAIANHVDKEDKTSTLIQGSGSNYKSKTIIINESGLYSLILSSKLPKAKEFKRWVTSEVLPNIRKTGIYTVEQKYTEQEAKILETNLINARSRQEEARNKRAELLMELGNKTDIPEYKQIITSYAGNLLMDHELLPLPEVEEKTYSATEIGKMFGVSSQKIGRLATKHHLRTNEYGKYFYDKSRYSNKEIETFRYYENAIDKFNNILNNETKKRGA